MKNGFDIAVLRLPRAVYGVFPSLPEQNTELHPGTMVTVLGWGDSRREGEAVDALQVATGLVVVDNDNCPGIPDSIKDHMLCAYAHSKNSCNGGQPSLIFHGIFGCISMGVTTLFCSVFPIYLIEYISMCRMKKCVLYDIEGNSSMNHFWGMQETCLGCYFACSTASFTI